MAKKQPVAALEEQSVSIELPPINFKIIEIELVGDSALICHAWSDKAKKQMLGKQMGKAQDKKERKDPEQDFRDSLYPIPGVGYGFPSVAFKAAAVGACRFAEGMKMTAARGAFHVVGEMVKIDGTPTMREDMVRIAMGTADIRYRGEFREWRAKLIVRYNASALTAEQIIHLFNIAGFGVGVGEWRPEKDGSYGMFHVAVDGQ